MAKGDNKKDYKALRQQAYDLLDDEWTQQDISAYLQVSEQSICKWVKDRNKGMNKAQQLKRRKDVKKAMQLYFIEGYHQTRIAKEIGVSQQTMCKWFKILGINARNEQYAINVKNIVSAMQLGNDLDGFMSYLKKYYPTVHASLKPFYNEYKNMYSDDKR